MRTILTLLLCSFVLGSTGMAQEVIENPETPLNKDAGRIVKPQAVLSIKDMGDDYYFQDVRNIKISPEGFIFIQDWEQLLQFDREGNYIRNFLKKGKGPGEVEYVRNFCIFNGDLVAHDTQLNKILWFDMNGNLVKEFRIYEPIGFAYFVNILNNRYYFFKSEIPLIKGKPRVVDYPQDLVSYSPEKKELRDLSSFPIKSFVAVSGRSKGSIGINHLIVVPYKSLLYISHTPEYLIKVYDLKNEKTVLIFNREYKREQTPPEVKGKQGGEVILNGKEYTRPPQKYLNDIKNLLVYKDKLWVMTSKTDEEKGIFIDVFDFEGRYVDNFFLQLPVIKANNIYVSYEFWNMALSEDAVYVVEPNEDGTNQVVKYVIENQ
jgi:hypothetical protein